MKRKEKVVNKIFTLMYLCRFFVAISMAFFAVGISALAQEKSTAEEPVPKQEYAENYVFADTSKRKEFLELTAVLRCPKCQNQNIAASDAPIAHDMRRKTYQLMQEGKDKGEIIEWMKVRYGDFVHYQPPVTALTIWLWVLPVLFAVSMLVFFIRRRKPELEQDIEAKLARADQMLKDD
jgi:cytochrome c-type biogenesis protein CcmH